MSPERADRYWLTLGRGDPIRLSMRIYGCWMRRPQLAEVIAVAMLAASCSSGGSTQTNGYPVEHLREMASAWAAAKGEPDPESIRVVRTNLGRTYALVPPGDDLEGVDLPPDDTVVWVIQSRGDFDCRTCSKQAVLTQVVEVDSERKVFGVLSDETVPLGQLGNVVDIN